MELVTQAFYRVKPQRPDHLHGHHGENRPGTVPENRAHLIAAKSLQKRQNAFVQPPAKQYTVHTGTAIILPAKELSWHARD